MKPQRYLLGRLGGEVPDGLVAGRTGARDGDVGRAEELEVARVGLGFGGRHGAEAEAEAGEGAEFEEVATVRVFRGGSWRGRF